MKKLCVWFAFLLLLFMPITVFAASFEYVTPQSDTLVLGEAFKIDFEVTKNGRAIFSVLDGENKQCARFGVNKKKGKKSSYVWKGKSDGVYLEEGQYTLQAYHERDEKEDVLLFPLRIVKELPSELTSKELLSNEESAPVQTVEEKSMTPEYTSPPKQKVSPNKWVSLTIGGDCILGSEEKKRKSPFSFDSIVQEKGESWPFSGLLDLFQKDDITFVNLECVLKDDSRDLAPHRMHNFRGPTSFTNILKLGSVETVNIANNHYIDYGATGKKTTRGALEAAGIPFSGYGFTHVYEVNGVKVGFAGIRETIYLQGRNKIKEDIQILKEKGADVIIYTCHFGKEYSRTHNELQTKMAHEAIDLGADIVIGHHPHVVQGIEVYKERPIFYSIANLVFGGNLLLTEFDSVLLDVQLNFYDDQYLGCTVQLHPVLTTGSAPANDFRPVLAESKEDKARILKKIQEDTPFLVSLAGMDFAIEEQFWQ